MEAKTSKLSKLDVAATARKKLSGINSTSTTTTSSSIPRRVYTPRSWKENGGGSGGGGKSSRANSATSDSTQSGPKSPTRVAASIGIKNGPKAPLASSGALNAAQSGGGQAPNGAPPSTTKNGPRAPLASSSTITSTKAINRPKSKLAKSVAPSVQSSSEPSNKETSRVQRANSTRASVHGSNHHTNKTSQLSALNYGVRTDKIRQDPGSKNQATKLSKQSSLSSSHTNNSAVISTTGSMTKKAAERSKSFNLKTQQRPQTTDHHKPCKKKLALAQNHINSCLSAFDAMSCLVQYLTEELDAFSTPLLRSENKLLRKKTELLETSLAEQEATHRNELLSLSAENLKVISELEAEHRTEFEAWAEQINQEHSEEIATLSEKFEDDVQKVNEEHEMETAVLIENHEIQVSQTANEHQSELEALIEDYEGKQAELQTTHEEEIEKIKTDESYTAQYIKELHETNRNARAEVESLKSVLELKREDITKLRLQSAELENKVHSLYNAEDMIKRLEAKNEEFQALVEKKNQSERQLSSEQIKLRQSLDKESNEKKRLSMENEELQWKLQNFSASGAGATSPLKAAHLFFAEEGLKSSPEDECSLEEQE